MVFRRGITAARGKVVMLTEQDKTLEALRIAVQMEIDGKKYYQKVSQSSDNQLGRELFQSLAAEEDIHRQKFEEIYDAISKKMTWPRVDLQSDGGKKLKTVFAEATRGISLGDKGSSTELDAVQTAMTMENKTYDFYAHQGKQETSKAAREFYESLAAQERIHHQVLLDYYEYLKDPAAWFVAKEHTSMDGG